MLVTLGQGISQNIKPNINMSVGNTFSDFLYNADTLYFDFTDEQNTIETSATNTLSRTPELIHGNNMLTQATKDYQPLLETNGIKFNNGTDRSLTIENPTLTNGTTGFYVALNLYKNGGGKRILTISRNTSSTESRAKFEIAGNNSIGFSADDNDGGSPNFLGYTSQSLTNGQWYTVEMQLVADGIDSNPLTIWIDGVEQTFGYEAGNVFSPFPTTDPKYFILGNDYNTNFSYDGGMQNFIFQNSVPSTAMRQSISDYLVGVKP